MSENKSMILAQDALLEEFPSEQLLLKVNMGYKKEAIKQKAGKEHPRLRRKSVKFRNANYFGVFGV